MLAEGTLLSPASGPCASPQLPGWHSAKRQYIGTPFNCSVELPTKLLRSPASGYLVLVGLPSQAGLLHRLPASSSPPAAFYPTTPMNDQNALRARIRRLEELSLGLSLDEEHFRTCSCPIMADEREKYREGRRQAIAGGETARLALVMACQRIDKARAIFAARREHRSSS